MANYNTNKAQAGVTPKYLADGDVAVFSFFIFPLTSPPTLTLNDTITCCTIPGLNSAVGITITGVTMDVDKLDGGTVALKLNVGDANNSARFISQSTAGQAGGYQVPNVNGGMGFVYTTNLAILITVQTTAGGAVPVSGGTGPGGAARASLVMNYCADP